jgi:hypothetical protein
MRVAGVAALLMLTPAIQLDRLAASGGLAMRQVEACRTRPTVEAMLRRDIGRVAVYQVTADREGATVAAKRTSEEPRLLSLVQIDAFESCVMRWIFAQSGTYTVTLWGGASGIHQIDIAKGADILRVSVPEFTPR